MSLETESLQEELKQLSMLKRHIRMVQDSCELLAERLMDKNSAEAYFSRLLIANSFLHDQSKFKGIEWDYLVRDADEEKLKLAVKQHQDSNPHHPEYWGGIEHMPRIYQAEMVCDWYTRSNEMGSNLRDWIKKTAVERYKIPYQGKTYKAIKEFVDLLIDKPFKKVSPP